MLGNKHNEFQTFCFEISALEPGREPGPASPVQPSQAAILKPSWVPPTLKTLPKHQVFLCFYNISNLTFLMHFGRLLAAKRPQNRANRCEDDPKMTPRRAKLKFKCS